jgi:porin
VNVQGGNGETHVKSIGRLQWVWAGLAIAGLGLLMLSGDRVRAQDPLIIPGLPANGLQIGERPPPTSSPHVNPLDTDAETSTEPTEVPPLEAPPFGLTGNWFGARDSLAGCGLDFRANVAQFYQGLTTGGLGDEFGYGLKVDFFGTIDGEKLLGWSGLFVNIHEESRFGQSINGNVGSLIPANFALEFPNPTGAASALTNMQFEQFVSPELVVTVGRLNAADGVNIHPFLGGNGVDRFMNEAFVLSPIYGRTIPYSTFAAGFSYLRESDPVFTFLVLDASGRPDAAGFRELFSNGASLFAHLRVPVRPFGLPGHQSLEGAYTSGKFSPFSKDDYVILQQPPMPANPLRGSWVITYGFDQFLIVDPEAPTKGWGIFGNLSLADQSTNPIHWFLNVGTGGTSPLRGRTADSFGVAYYYSATSNVVQQALQPVSPIRNEQGVEFFYNARITSWFVLTADLQVIDPAQVDARTTLVLGLRAKIAL